MGWDKDKVNLMVLNMTKQSLFCLLEIVETKERCFCSFVYASNNGNERRVLWDEINAAKIIVDKNPWCLLGNFNVTIKAEEHSSGGSTINEDMQEFIDCLNEVEVEDIHSSGKFIPIVKEGWEKEIEGHNMFKVVKKLKMLKVHLRSLAWKNGNLHDRVEKYRDNLRNAQILMERTPLDDQLKKEEAECLSLYLEDVEDEESFMLQEAKLDWISKGDRNTKFFHKIIKSRENLNKITSVCNEKCENFEGNEVAEKFVNHFKKFLGADKDCEDLDDSELFH
ncbi:RNA-directed DNA polymerase, eukaryota, reverse transcriptase zinc-binding domain protein [Tanacetum coccineum]